MNLQLLGMQWGELQEHVEGNQNDPWPITEPYGHLSSDVEKIIEAFEHNDRVLAYYSSIEIILRRVSRRSPSTLALPWHRCGGHFPH